MRATSVSLLLLLQSGCAQGRLCVDTRGHVEVEVSNLDSGVCKYLSLLDMLHESDINRMPSDIRIRLKEACK